MSISRAAEPLDSTMRRLLSKCSSFVYPTRVGRFDSKWCAAIARIIWQRISTSVVACEDSTTRWRVPVRGPLLSNLVRLMSRSPQHEVVLKRYFLCRVTSWTEWRIETSAMLFERDILCWLRKPALNESTLAVASKNLLWVVPCKLVSCLYVVSNSLRRGACELKS
jgi:hypothetical protein